MTPEKAIGPCWVVEAYTQGAIIRRQFKTISEVIAYETDKPSGMRSWNVIEGETEQFIPVEVLQ